MLGDGSWGGQPTGGISSRTVHRPRAAHGLPDLAEVIHVVREHHTLREQRLRETSLCSGPDHPKHGEERPWSDLCLSGRNTLKGKYPIPQK